MARPTQSSPAAFAKLISAEIRREMGDRRMSGRALALQLGRSEKYVRERVNDTFEFALNDIEAFCDLIGVLPEDFVARVESAPGAVISKLPHSNVGGGREAIDLHKVPFTGKEAASEDGTSVDPSRGES